MTAPLPTPQLAEAVGVTRTDLIKDAITKLVADDGPAVQHRIALLEQELHAMRTRLDAARHVLLADITVAA